MASFDASSPNTARIYDGWAPTSTATTLCVMLVARPPRTAVSAAGYLVLTLTVAFTLAPATRWGYVVYPAAIACWLWLSGLVTGRPSGSPRHPQPDGAATGACVRSG